MAIVRWDPTRELDSLQGEMNRLFSSFFETPTGTKGNGTNGAVRRWIPSIDLVETQAHFVLKADLPGMSENDVGIELENNVLTIAGERKTEHEQQHEGYYRLERAIGSFSRALSLPEGVDPEAVAATFDNGVLTVRIPKPAQARPRKVKIGVGGAAPQTIEADATGASSGQ